MFVLWTKMSMHDWMIKFGVVVSCFFRFCCCAFAPSVNIHRIENSQAREKAGEQWTIDDKFFYKFSVKWFMNAHHIVTQRVHIHKKASGCVRSALYVWCILCYSNNGALCSNICIYISTTECPMSIRWIKCHRTLNIVQKKIGNKLIYWPGWKTEPEKKWMNSDDKNIERMSSDVQRPSFVNHKPWAWVYNGDLYSPNTNLNTYWIELKCELWPHIE